MHQHTTFYDVLSTGMNANNGQGDAFLPYPFFGLDHSRQIAAGLYMNRHPMAGQITDGIINLFVKRTKDTRDSLMMSTNFCLKTRFRERYGFHPIIFKIIRDDINLIAFVIPGLTRNPVFS